MTETRFSSEMRRLAYDQTAGAGPGVVFLSGLNSTKDGTKALYLEDWAKRQGRAFLRFDYSGHGGSSGRFEDGTISRWTADAEAIIDGLTKGPQVLVGSSMGGWLALLLARRRKARIFGLVTIAAAPDFTEDRYWAGFDEPVRNRLETDGFVRLDSQYDDEPYTITKSLIEDGRENLVLRSPLNLPFPVRFLHGTMDEAIPTETAERLFAHATGADIRLTLVKGADHRFSTPRCLTLISETIDSIAPRNRS